MNTVKTSEEMKNELEYGLCKCKSDDIKEMIRKKISQCTISRFQYCNFVQAEIIDVLGLDQEDFIDKYGQQCRELLNKDLGIDAILSELINKSNNV